MNPLLDYQSPAPRRPPPDPERAERLRTMACFLAIGATFWGILCAFILLSANAGGLVIFGPGYLLTIGYYWRAFGDPSPQWCRAIWGFSSLIQGAWFTLIAYMAFTHPLGFISSIGFACFALLVTLWWLGAFAMSLTGFFMESRS